MTVDYKLISCDDHLDLNMLPEDLWSSRMPAHLKDRAPHVEEKDGRWFWVCDGQNWGSWSGRGKRFSGPKPIFTALDRGGVEDQTERRPGVPELRLADMDRAGVYTHVIFGPVTSIVLDDEELRDTCYRVYNDWLRDFCSVAPDRLLGVPMLPPHPESAVKELQRLAAQGWVKQANLQVATAEPQISDARWEPLFNALAGNPLAAMPSLHFATSAMAAFVLTDAGPVEGAVGWTYALTLGFALVYLGEHYVVDLLAGMGLVLGVRAMERPLAPLLRSISHGVNALEARVTG